MNYGLESFAKLQSLLKELINTITLDQALILGENIDIIETELKRLEEIDSRSSMRLENIVPHLYDDNEELKRENTLIHEMYRQLVDKAQKQDEILRIIKEKKVCIKALLLSSNAKEYNTYCDLNNLASKLTQTEYDLLKGYFK